KRREPHQAVLGHAGMAAANRDGSDIPPGLIAADQRRHQVLADLYGWIHEKPLDAGDVGRTSEEKQWGRKARAVELYPRLARRGVRCGRELTGMQRPGIGSAWQRKKDRVVCRAFFMESFCTSRQTLGIIAHSARKSLLPREHRSETDRK